MEDKKIEQYTDEMKSEQILEKEKISKEFKTVFIINSIVMLIFILLCVYAFSYKAKTEGLLKMVEIFSVGFVVVIQIILSFLTSLIILIITIISGIKNYRKNECKNTRKKIIVMLSNITIFHIVILVTYIINVYILK